MSFMKIMVLEDILALEIVEADNKLNEYIKIIYAKNEVLYVFK